jgi:hypothetical protein
MSDTATCAPGTIDRYLTALARELRLPPRLRRRILAEAREHLLDARAELQAAGWPAPDAERQAVRRFGASRQLGRCFVEDLAAATARRSAAVTTLAVATVVAGFPALVLAAIMSGDPPSGAIPPPPSPLPSVLLLLAFQFAVVGGGLGLVRWLRWSGTPAIPMSGLRMLLRSTGVAVGSAMVAVASEVALLLDLPPADRASPFAAALTAVSGTGSLATLAALVAVGQAAVRAARQEQLAPAAAEPVAGPLNRHDVLDDLLALTEVARSWSSWRWPALALGLERTVDAGRRTWWWFQGRCPQLASWADLRRHPWRVCLAVTLAAAVGSAQWGRDPGEPLSTVALWSGLEAAAVVAGFALLGGFLGLRPPVWPRRAGLARGDYGDYDV